MMEAKTKKKTTGRYSKDDILEVIKKSDFKNGKIYDLQKQKLINSLDVQRSQRKDNPKPSKTNHFKAFVKRMEKLKMEDELSKILYTSSKTEKLTFNQLQEQRRVAGVSTKGHGGGRKGAGFTKEKREKKKALDYLDKNIKLPEGLKQDLKEKKPPQTLERLKLKNKKIKTPQPKVYLEGKEMEADEKTGKLKPLLDEVDALIAQSKEVMKQTDKKKMMEQVDNIRMKIEDKYDEIRNVYKEKPLPKVYREGVEVQLDETKFGGGSSVGGKGAGTKIEGVDRSEDEKYKVKGTEVLLDTDTGKTEIKHETEQKVDSNNLSKNIEVIKKEHKPTREGADNVREMKKSIEKAVQDKREGRISTDLYEASTNVNDTQTGLSRGGLVKQPEGKDMPQYTGETKGQSEYRGITTGEDVDLMEIDRPFGSGMPTAKPIEPMTKNVEKEDEHREEKTFKKLVDEIKAYRTLYNDLIKTKNYKSLSKLKLDGSITEIRKIHENFTEEIREYYLNEKSVKLGVILSPEILGINIHQLQSILAPQMPTYASHTIDDVSQRKALDPKTLLPIGGKRVQRDFDVHYHRGGIQHGLNAPPEKELHEMNKNPIDFNKVLNPLNTRINIDDLPIQKKLFYKQHRHSRILNNIRIKS